MKSLVLMGIKHCGKTTQGKLLAQKLNLPFYDTDDLITKEYKKTPREIYNEGGKAEFMKAEAAVCKKLCESLKQEQNNCVIATGGGICDNTEALDALHDIGIFIFLCAEEETAANRIVREIKTEKDGTLTNLPSYIAKKSPSSLLEVRKIFHDFYTERVKIYSSIADVSIQMKNAPKEENLSLILKGINL